MSPGECIQALAKLHLGAPEARKASTTETKPDRVAKKEHKHATEKGELDQLNSILRDVEKLRDQPTEPGATGSEAEQLRAIRREYQNLLNPPTKGDAPENEPGYNSRMRDEMRRAIEGIGGSKEGAE